MYAGHAAMGLALQTAAADRSRRSVAVLVGASLAADVAWCVLTFAGVEGGRSLGTQALHSPRLPWSHSLLSTVVLAGAFAGLAAALTRGRRGRAAGLAATAVGLHWLVGDVPFGEAFPIAPWTAPVPTLHLYGTWPVAFALDTAVVIGGLAVYARGRSGAVLAAVLLGLHLVAWVPTFVGEPPMDLDADGGPIVLYLVLLGAAWAACVAAPPARAG